MAGREPIRVLQSVGAMSCDGVENLAVNDCRKVGRSLVQLYSVEHVVALSRVVGS